MKLTSMILSIFFAATLLTISAQQSNPLPGVETPKTMSPALRSVRHIRRKRFPTARPVIPPATVIHNPEYLSGEASVTVAANSNPLIRIGIAQNGVTLIEFPASDKFFAIHPGNSDLVTVEKSPSLKRDHHLVLRAGNGFLVPSVRSKGVDAIIPATSIIAQMDSGMAITLMIYPVPLLKQQAHRLVINYNRDEVISARRSSGLATDLVGLEREPQPIVVPASSPSDSTNRLADSAPPPPDPQQKTTNADFKKPTEDAVAQAVANPKLFRNWTEQRHGLQISALPPRELNDAVTIVVFVVRNSGAEPLRLIAGYPDMYVETLNEYRRPVEAGTKVEKLFLASSATDNVIGPGRTHYFALAYVTPILGAQQHLKIVVAHMNAADEPAIADLTALAQ